MFARALSWLFRFGIKRCDACYREGGVVVDIDRGLDPAAAEAKLRAAELSERRRVAGEGRLHVLRPGHAHPGHTAGGRIHGGMEFDAEGLGRGAALNRTGNG